MLGFVIGFDRKLLTGQSILHPNRLGLLMQGYDTAL